LTQLPDFISLEKSISILEEAKKIKPSTAQDYRKATKAIGIPILVLNSLDATWEMLIKIMKSGKMPSYVELYFSACKSALRIRGIKPSGETYVQLEGLIVNREREKRLAYDEEQVKTLLKACLYNEIASYYTYKTILTLRMTGARVSSLANVTLSGFKNVPGYNDVFYCYVPGKSKKKTGFAYPILLGTNVMDDLLLHSNVDDDKIHNWNPKKNKTSFRDYVRSNFCYKLGVYKRNSTDPEEQERLKNILVDRSVLHSLRKSYAVQMSKDPSLREHLVLQSLLMGHIPNVMVLSAYSMAGETFDSSLERMAEGFSKSSFMKSNFWKGLKPK
jgi:hypothetical protein